MIRGCVYALAVDAATPASSLVLGRTPFGVRAWIVWATRAIDMNV